MNQRRLGIMEEGKALGNVDVEAHHEGPVEGGWAVEEGVEVVVGYKLSGK
jgi:hypothetical protein